MGVVTKVALERGSLFGPYPISDMEEALKNIGTNFNDDSQCSMIEIDPWDVVNQLWMSNISTAQSDGDENMCTIQKSGSIFFQTTRIIAAGEELRVWFGLEHIHQLQLRHIVNNNDNGNKMVCSDCGAHFDHTRVWQSHMLFTCTSTQSKISDSNTKKRGAFDIDSILSKEQPENKRALPMVAAFASFGATDQHVPESFVSSTFKQQAAMLRYSGTPLYYRRPIPSTLNPERQQYGAVTNPDIRLHLNNASFNSIEQFGIQTSLNESMQFSLLPTAKPELPQLNQNWCAKCNMSFRMTGDLVYHMRIHHKSENENLTHKKDDKLRCKQCGESFKERHHLTRHMASH